MTERVCGMCKKVLPLTSFYVRSDRKAPTSKCKACFGLYQKKYKAQEAIKDRDRTARAEWQRKAACIHRETLATPYVKKLLTQKTVLTFDQIPNALVELKRAQIRLERELKDRA